MLDRVFKFRSLLVAIVLACLATPAMADVYLEQVNFSCSGKIRQVIETEEGERAVGLVNLKVKLPNKKKWFSAGIVAVSIPSDEAGTRIKGKAIKRCRGVADVQAEVTGTLNDVDIWTLTLIPSQMVLRAGKVRVTDPVRVEFNSSAGGSPNV